MSLFDWVGVLMVDGECNFIIGTVNIVLQAFQPGYRSRSVYLESCASAFNAVRQHSPWGYSN